MPKNARIVVLGNACQDTTYRLQRLPTSGETLLAKRVTQDLGGKGLIQAIAARRAGADVVVIAAVGTDAVADLIRDTLAAEQIPIDTIIAKDGQSDGSVIMLDESGENCIVSATQQVQAISPEDVLPHLKLEPGDILLLQGNLSWSVTTSAIAHAKRAGATVAVNLAPLQAWFADLLKQIDIAIANAAEAMAFTGVKVPEDAIIRLNVSIAIVTLGRHGCLVRQGTEPIVKIAAPKIEAHDSTGAGDVFVGAFLSEWLKTGEVVAAANLAVHAASDMASRIGTASAIPDKTTIERLRSNLRSTA
jgi:ribokinase